MTKDARSPFGTARAHRGTKLLQAFQSHVYKRNSKRWKRALAELQAATGDNRMQAQVCPNGCSHQLARRDVVTRTRLSGRAEIRVEPHFETKHCAKCGAIFQRKCGRCEAPVLAPVTDRCESCGFPYPWAAERRATAMRSQPRQWRQDEDNSNPSPARLLISPRVGRELLVVEGDITTFEIDAVVSNDDVDGRMWATVASAIKSVAGSDIERESVSHGPFPLGAAWFTHGGKLPVKGVIHVAAMDRHGRTPKGHDGKDSGLEIIRACIRAALDEALKRDIQSVALATIGTGFQDIGIRDWLIGLTPDIVKYLRSQIGGKDANKKLAVLLVLYERDDFDELVQSLEKMVASV